MSAGEDTSLDARTDDDGSFDRRSMLTKLGVGVGVAWAAPVILSTPAFAQGTPCASPESFNWSDNPSDIDNLDVVNPFPPPPFTPAFFASTNRSVQVTYIPSLDPSSTATVSYGSGTQGGQTGNFIEVNIDGTPSASEFVDLNFELDLPVNQMAFKLLDIDTSNGAWIDRVEVQAFSDILDGTPVVISASDYTVVNPSFVTDTIITPNVLFEGLPPAVPSSDTDGNVNFHFTSAVIAIRVRYIPIGSDRQLQQIGISEFTFCI